MDTHSFNFQTCPESQRFECLSEDQKRRRLLTVSNDDIAEFKLENDDRNGANPNPNLISSKNSGKKAFRVELKALPSMAKRADCAMCRFRCAILSPGAFSFSSVSLSETKTNEIKDHRNHYLLWRDALESNSMYRRALFAAAASLTQTCFHETQHLRYFKRHLLQTAQTIDATTTGTTLPSIEQLVSRQRQHYTSIQSSMKSTAMAILMAGIASSHLHLYAVPQQTCDGKHARSSTNYNSKPEWNVLVDTAMIAADLLLARKELLLEMEICSETNERNSELFLPLDFNEYQMKDSCIKELEHCFNTINDALGQLIDEVEGEKDRGTIVVSSFRIALKVAAISCERTILPSVSNDKGAVPTERRYLSMNQKQTQDFEKNEAIISQLISQHNLPDSSNDHHNASLFYRENLVDALLLRLAVADCNEIKIMHSFSDSKMSKNIPELLDKSEFCFEHAIQWECRMRSLLTKSLPSTRTCNESTEYAWNIRNNLLGMEIASDVSRVFDPGRCISKIYEITKAVESLALSSCSRYACDLMGCIHAQSERYPCAVEMFQMSLEQGNKQENNNSSGNNSTISFSCINFNTDEEIDNTIVQHRTILNMASCFVAMGNLDAPLTILLHLWQTLSESIANSGAALQPQAILMSFRLNELESGYVRNSHMDFAKIQALWMLFYISSLAEDYAICLGSTEEMRDLGRNDKNTLNCLYGEMSNAFALLQCERPSKAQDIINRLVSKSQTIDPYHPLRYLTSIFGQVYKADVCLILERNLSPDDKSSPFNNTYNAMNTLKSFSALWGNISCPLLHELHAYIQNNHGISFLIEGDYTSARRCFQEASKYVTTIPSRLDAVQNNTNPQCNAKKHILLIPICFNLSLLLLQQGSIERSAKIWLSVRGYVKIWEKAVQGDNNSLSELLSINIRARNTLKAEYSMWRKTLNLSEYHKHVMEWIPAAFEKQGIQRKSHIDGLDSFQVIALDSVLLHYASSVAKRKSSLLFHKKAGTVLN